MCVLYVSFRSNVRPRTFGCVVMGNVVFILRFRLLLYSAGSGVNIEQVVLSGFSVRVFCFVQEMYYVGMVVCISWLHSWFFLAGSFYYDKSAKTLYKIFT